MSVNGKLWQIFIHYDSLQRITQDCIAGLQWLEASVVTSNLSARLTRLCWLVNYLISFIVMCWNSWIIFLSLKIFLILRTNLIPNKERWTTHTNTMFKYLKSDNDNEECFNHIWPSDLWHRACLGHKN